jgi:hypothetical protein
MLIRLIDWNRADEDRKRELIDMHALNMHPPIPWEQLDKMKDSLQVLTRFFWVAHDVAEKREHYSARTIIEVIRHNSALEDEDKHFKINNNMAKPLAQISMYMFPTLNGLFEIRSPTFKADS